MRTRPWKSKLTICSVLFGVMAGLILLLAVGGRFWITSDHARRMIQARINEAIPGALLWEELRLSFFAGHVEIRNLRLQGPAGEEIASLDRGFVDLAWPALLRGELEIEAVALEAPRVCLNADRNGELNLLTAFPEPDSQAPPAETAPTSGRFPLNLVIGALSITDGFFEYATEGPSETIPRIALPSINLTIEEANLSEESARLSLLLENGAITGALVDRLVLSCELKEKLLVFKELAIQSPMGRVAATGEVDLLNAFKEGLTAPERDLEAIAYNLTLRQTGTSLASLPGKAGGMTGEVDSTLSLEGVGITPGTLSAKALLEASGRNLAMGQALPPHDLTLRAEATLENNRLTIPQVVLDSGEARLEGSGRYDLTSSAVEAALNLIVPSLAGLKVPAAVPALAGKLALDVGISGSLEKPVVDARLSGEGLGVGGIPLGTLRLHTGLDNAGMLTISEMDLSSQAFLLEAEGTVRLFENGISTDFPADLTLKLHRLKPRDFLKEAGVTGELNGVLTVKGPLLSPKANLFLEGRALSVGTFHAGDLNTRLRLDQGMLFVDEARLANGKSRLTLSGSTRVLDGDSGQPITNPSYDIRVESEGLFLEDFVQGMRGKLVLHGRVRGDLTHPRGSVALEGDNLDLGVQRLQSVAMACRFDKDRITVDSLSIALAPGEKITAKGRVSLADRQYDLQVISTGLSLQHIDAIDINNTAEGILALRVSGKGHLDSPRLDGEVTLTRLRLNNEPFPDGTLKLNLLDNTVNLNGTLLADLEGWFNLSTQEFLAKAELDQIGLTPFFNMIGRKNLSGSVTGLIEVKGNAASPEKIHALVEISQLSLFQDALALVSAGEFNASFDNGTILVPGINFTLFDQGHLKISGEGNLAGAMDFKADGTIPLKVVHLFIEDLSGVTGDVELTAHLKGTREEPEFHAEIALNALGITVPVLEQKLHNVNGRILVTPEAVTVEELTGNLDKGQLTLSGSLTLDDFMPVSVNAQLKAQALPITLPDTMEALLHGELSLKGSPEKSLISGNIIFLEGLYYKDVKLGLFDSIGQRRREAPPATRSGTNPLLKNTRVDVTIRHRSPFVVDNNIALMALKPTLAIRGPLEKPVVSGRAQVESGVISYLGKEFEIKKGVIDFLNPYKVEATIDVDAEARIRRWTINLKVSGVPENLKFEMTSTPAETDADILSLLVFNKTRSEMIKGEGGSNTSSKQILADMIAQTFEENLKDATGLDTIEMKYTERPGQEGADDVNITVGKELSKRITVKYGVGTKNGVTVQSAISEYKFYENLLINAFRDTDGDFGGEMVFRLEFR